MAVDAIKAINIMKSGGGMDGAFSHSPNAVRDPTKGHPSSPENGK